MSKYIFSTQTVKTYYCNSIPGFIKDTATSIVGRHLLDTLIDHKDGCVGIAANMIGVCKRIIVFNNEGTYVIMFNPDIIKTSRQYDAEKNCLSLLGDPHKCKRYHAIKV